MADSLTGVWDGTFVQPGVGAVTFMATLIETRSALSGSVIEPCMMPGCPRSEHNALLAGSRSGSAVSFVKRYDPPGYGYDTVHYDGSVNADATEIDGRWRVEGVSGTFLMIRSGKPAEAVAAGTQVKQPAR
jgi:hypothetical protein